MMSVSRCIALLLVFSSGCVAFQDCKYLTAQNCRAHTAWWFSCDERCSSNPFSHYSRGWRRGYAAVLQGSDGECPPVPPQHYWSPKFQSGLGQCAIENWFLGYGDGAAAAFASCRDQYHPVPFSGQFFECGPGCLPSDYSPYAFGRTILGLRNASPVSADINSDEAEAPGIPAVPPAPAAPAEPGNYDPTPDAGPMPSEASPMDEPQMPPTPESKPNDSASNRAPRAAGKWVKPASLTTKLSNSIIQMMSGKSN